MGDITRRPLVAGNWKMHGLRAGGTTLAQGVAAGVADLVKPVASVGGAAAGAMTGPRVDVVVCPPFTLLGEVGRAIAGSGVELGAQNVHWEDKGAFTGEIAAPMLVELGCSYVIIGHSERRQYFGETDEGVRKRAEAALRSGLRPIVCVGETWEERQAGRTEEVIGRQLRGALSGNDAGAGGASASGGATTATGAGEPPALSVAYEPVWAIGTGRAASGGDAQAVAAFIRSLLGELVGPETSRRVRILYGGSVKPENMAEFAGQPDVDGALVGGASLDAAAFAAICGQVAR